MSAHPGGINAIKNRCGTDATTAFNSNSVGHNHSSTARGMLPTYYVGDVAP
jgi:cytochrome b involved in lipid metabolism